MKKFYKNLEKLEVKNSSETKKIEKLQTLIKNIKTPKLKSKNKHFNTILENVEKNFELAIFSWQKEMDKIIKEYEFSSYLKNKFIVIVYGKVNAGKSTLGNFVAQNSIKKVNFFVYESNDKKSIDKLEEFKTDNLECTSAIQGFEIDSLAWIDTPGLLSMTKQNSELAKKYINAADFIIFPTSSDSPMQKSEIEELKELQKYNKKFHIIITKSDTTEEDEVNGELVKIYKNKSMEVRKAQEEDVKNRSKDEGIEVENVFSVSIKMAKEGDLEGSNISKFYEFMNESLIKKAEKLKNENQSKRLEGFIKNDILKNIETLKNSISKLKNEKEKIDKKIDLKLKYTKNDSIFIVDNLIVSNMDSINKYNVQEKFKKIYIDAYKQLENKILEDVKEIFESFDVEFKNFMKNVDISNLNIEDKYREVEVKTTTITKEVATAGGAAAGAAIGGMFGGPLGALIGGAIGGYAGSKVAEILDKDTKTDIKRIKAGDNKIEVIRNFKMKLVDKLSNSADEFYKSLKNDFTKEVGDIIKSLENELEKIKKELK